MNTGNLTRPLGLRAPVGEHYVPPAYFYQIPRVADYFGTIESMLLDDQISASLQLRKRRALSYPWRWHEQSDPAAVAWLNEVFDEITFEHDLEDALACLEFGFIPVQPRWYKDGDRWRIECIERSEPRAYRFAKDGTAQYQSAGFEWQRVPAHRVFFFTHDATQLNPYGRSILEPCYPRWQGKWHTMNQLDLLGDKYAVPPVVALTDATDDTELNKVSAALAGLESAAGVALSGVRDLKALKVEGKAADLLNKIKDHDAAISKVITGQVLAMDKGDTGSYAMAKVHEDSLGAIALLDFKSLLSKLSRTLLSSILAVNNIPGKARMVFDKDRYEQQQAPPPAPHQPMRFDAPAPADDNSLTLMV